jgi:hypothetical protein
VEIRRGRRASATAGGRSHPRHCLCPLCPPQRGSVAGDWLADRWSGLRGRLRRRRPLRDPDQGLPLPAWVIDALAEPDLHDAGR